MSDFFIDFRNKRRRNISSVVDLMRYFDDIKVHVYENDYFALALSRADDDALWGPYKSPDNNIFISLAGRIALENSQWEEAKQLKAKGVLHAKLSTTCMQMEESIASIT